MSNNASESPSTGNRVGAIILGLLFLLLALGLFVLVQLTPMIGTMSSSFQLSRFGSPRSVFVGLENYTRLFEDERYWGASGFTVVMVIVRVLLIATVPLIGLLAGAGNRGVRAATQVLLSLIAIIVTPVSLAVIWRVMFDPQFGLFTGLDEPLLVTPGGARIGVIGLDALVTVGVALAAGGTLFMMAVRGRDHARNPGRAAVAVWLLGVILAVGSAVKTFTVPYMLTAGGPGTATNTVSLYAFQESFQFMNVGVGATVNVTQMLLLMLVAVGVWLVLTVSRLRLRFAPGPSATNTGAGAAGLVVVGLFTLLYVALLLYAATFRWPGFDPERGFGGAFEAYGRTLFNTFGQPLVVIWMLQVPMMYILGMALGYLRPLGKIGSDILFLVFLLLAIMPPEVLGMAWFMRLAQADLLNAAIPVHMTSFMALVVFKLFFDGVHERLQTDPEAMFVRDGLLASFAVALVVGVVLSLLSTNELYWPLIATTRREAMTVPVVMVQLSGAFAIEFNALLAYALRYVWIKLLVFLPLLLLGYLLVVDRLALVAGEAVASVGAGVDASFGDLNTDDDSPPAETSS